MSSPVGHSIHQMLLRTDQRIRALSPLNEAVFEVVLLALLILFMLVAVQSW